MLAMRTFLNERPRWQYIVSAILSLVLTVYIDIHTDPELVLSPFYLVPVVIVAWGTGRRYGLVMAVASSLAWLLTILHEVGVRHHKILLIVDAVLRFLVYAGAAILLSAWRDAGRRLKATVEQRTAALQAEVVERKLAQDALQSLALELAEAEEAQRRQFAHDIHDAVGQNLSLLKLNLEALRRDNTTDSPTESTVSQSRLDNGIQAVDDLIQQTRTLTFELYPAPLDDLGLAPALQWQAEDFHRRVGARVSVLEHGLRMNLPMVMAHYLFRAIKELIGNAIKHGGADEVIVSLHWQVVGMRIVVDDDGCGFDTRFSPPVGQRRGLGLRGIRERLTALRGTMQIESQLREGTRVILELPVLPQNADIESLEVVKQKVSDRVV